MISSTKHRTILATILATLLLSILCLAAPATTITVKPDGSGDHVAIQAAIDAAMHGDEIIVSPGTYVENIHFEGKNIVLRSTDPTSPTIVATTIIDGNSSGSVVTFSGAEGTTCVLSGFTITNGDVSGPPYPQNLGGGINGNGTMATIENNTIAGNSAQYGGGLNGCNGTIQSNTITNNSASWYGGGFTRCSGTIQNNTITANSAIWGGGLSSCSGTIQNNTITSNSTGSGGGLAACGGTIQSNTITNNSADGGGGGLSSCHGTIQNNTISGNAAGSYGGGLHYCNATIQHNTILGNWVGYEGGGAGLLQGHDPEQYYLGQ
ncbi:nitrous oxide reductase family maturation protein NosD [Candidatus Sumerlaeota bacterium]